MNIRKTMLDEERMEDELEYAKDVNQFNELKSKIQELNDKHPQDDNFKLSNVLRTAPPSIRNNIVSSIDYDSDGDYTISSQYAGYQGAHVSARSDVAASRHLSLTGADYVISTANGSNPITDSNSQGVWDQAVNRMRIEEGQYHIDQIRHIEGERLTSDAMHRDRQPRAADLF
jgi:hypothetical protein